MPHTNNNSGHPLGLSKSDSFDQIDTANGIIEEEEVTPRKMDKRSDQDKEEDQQTIYIRKQRKAPTNSDTKITTVGTGTVLASLPRAASFNRSFYQPSIGAQSVRSHSSIDRMIPPPSTELEKSKTTRGYIATVTAICWVMFLVIFGIVVFVADAIKSRFPIPEYFCIFMIVLGFAYFVFLTIDIRLHIHRAKKAVEERERRQELVEQHHEQMNGGPMELNSNAPYQLNMQLPDWNDEPLKPISHKYCFSTGRHGELLYLKLGAAWFCFGLLIHSMLILAYQIMFLTSTDPKFYRCASVSSTLLEVLFPLYSLFLLFFIFKYANIIINEYRGLAKLALMHAIGTSLSFWVYTIVRETSDSIRLKKYKEGKDDPNADGDIDFRNIQPFSLECPGPESLNTIYRNFSPYLYPFVIEYCILIVGILYMIWANINKCPKKLSSRGHGITHSNSNASVEDESNMSDHCKTTIDHDNDYKSNLIVYADCHSSNKGLFSGLILVVLTIVFIILFFIAISEESYLDIGIQMNSAFELVVLVILVVAVILAYIQTSKLDVNLHPMSMLDDILLYIAIPAFFLDTIFSMIPAIVNGSILNIFTCLMQLIQVLIQTPWIMDGLRRCANASALRKNKPGRELVTFLTVANVSLWIFYTFSVKNAYTGDERYYFYGDVLWTILNHLSLPLIMFYRFHSSVCLVDIWRHAYEPGDFAH